MNNTPRFVLPGASKVRRPRVLHLTTTPMSLWWLLAAQLHAFRAAGFEVMTASGPGEHRDALIEAGFEHTIVPGLGRSVDPRSDIRAAKELIPAIARIRPDIVHTHNPKPGVLGRIAGRLANAPIIINTVHGLYAQPGDPLTRRAFVYAAERFAATFSDVELVQNSEDVAMLRRLGIAQDRIRLLGNGIDLERFRPTTESSYEAHKLRHQLRIPADVPVVGIVGRMVAEKGHHDFLRAVRQLRGSGCREFVPVVVGPEDPAKSDAISPATIGAMRAEGFRVLGARSDMETVLSLMDVFVLPSKREGFPRAAMEACAMGIPVVASDIRGCREVVVDGHNGSLVTLGNVSGFADAIGRLLDDDALRHRQGQAGVARAQAEFDQQRVITRTFEAYSEQLCRRGWVDQGLDSVSDIYVDSIDLVATDESNSLDVSSAP